MGIESRFVSLSLFLDAPAITFFDYAREFVPSAGFGAPAMPRQVAGGSGSGKRRANEPIESVDNGRQCRRFDRSEFARVGDGISGRTLSGRLVIPNGAVGRRTAGRRKKERKREGEGERARERDGQAHARARTR